MFHYTMTLTDKVTRKSKKIANLYLHRSIYDLGVREEQIRIYANQIDLNRYTISFTERQVKQMENYKCPFFKTKTGRFITMDEMIRAAEIIWGEDSDFYMDWYEIRDRIGAIEMTAKQVYDYALNKEDKILAIRAYRAIKAEQGDKYYSLLSARDHVEKILQKRRKEN